MLILHCLLVWSLGTKQVLSLHWSENGNSGTLGSNIVPETTVGQCLGPGCHPHVSNVDISLREPNADISLSWVPLLLLSLSETFIWERKEGGRSQSHKMVGSGLLTSRSVLSIWTSPGTAGNDTQALISYTDKGLWRWKSLNISVLILLNSGACYYTHKIKNQ